MCANVAEVTTTDPELEPMTPEAFISKAAVRADWTTIAQTDLLDQRFNKLKPGQRRTQYRTQHFDRYRAGWLAASAEEKQAYRNAQLRGQLLRRPGVPLDPTFTREVIAERVQRRFYRPDILGQSLWLQEIIRSTSHIYGFPIAYTTSLHTYLTGKIPGSDSSEDALGPAISIAKFVKAKVFGPGPSATFRPSAVAFHPGRRGFWEGKLWIRSRFIVSRSPTDHLVDDGPRTRFAHRMMRYGGSLETEADIYQASKSRYDEQYFVVLDDSILPIISDERRLRDPRDKSEIVAWLYDADWDPLLPSLVSTTPDANPNPTRDQDGYAGRIRVSYGYHLYVGIYQHLLQPGFNLKDIWAIHQSEDYVYRTQDLSVLPLIND